MVGNHRENGLWEGGTSCGGAEGTKRCRTEDPELPQPPSQGSDPALPQGLVWPLLGKAFWSSSGKFSWCCLRSQWPFQHPSSSCQAEFQPWKLLTPGQCFWVVPWCTVVVINPPQWYQWGQVWALMDLSSLWHSLACAAAVQGLAGSSMQFQFSHRSVPIRMGCTTEQQQPGGKTDLFCTETSLLISTCLRKRESCTSSFPLTRSGVALAVEGLSSAPKKCGEQSRRAGDSGRVLGWGCNCPVIPIFPPFTFTNNI